MAVTGTRDLFTECKSFRSLTDALRTFAESKSYQEFIPSSLSYEQVWMDKAGPEVTTQLWAFDGKGENPKRYALIPEVTGIIQVLYQTSWSRYLPKPIQIWYLAKCYRYERPQAGRYREFWQFGMERLGPYGDEDIENVYGLLQQGLELANLPQGSYDFKYGMERGLAYYTRQDRNIEVVCESLGAQKQIAGGGTYNEGVGFAIGIDRVLLAQEKLI